MGTLLIYWAIKVSNTLAFLNLENLLLARKAGDFIVQRRDAESYWYEGPLKRPELAFTKRCWVVPTASHGSQFRCSDSGEGVHAKLFIAFFTSHRSPLSERLEQATFRLNCTRCLFFIGRSHSKQNHNRNHRSNISANAKSLLLSFSNVLDCFNGRFPFTKKTRKFRW